MNLIMISLIRILHQHDTIPFNKAIHELTFVLHCQQILFVKVLYPNWDKYTVIREGSLWFRGSPLNPFPSCHFRIRGKRCALNVLHATKLPLLSDRQGLRRFLVLYRSLATSLAKEESEAERRAWKALWSAYLLSLINRDSGLWIRFGI